MVPLGESVAIALTLCVTSAFSQSPISRLLEWRPLTYLGAISYSLYLWQQPFLCTSISGAASAVGRFAYLATLAILSHHFLEKPMIKLGHRISAKSRKF